MRILVIVALVTTSLAIVESLKVNDCGGPNAVAKLLSVSVSGCDFEKDARCALVQGQNTTMQMEFETVAEFSSAKVDICGKVALIPLPFPLKPNQACGNYGFDCPVAPNEKKTFTISMPIEKFYPRLSVVVQLKMTNEIGKPIVCVEIPAAIVSQ